MWPGPVNIPWRPSVLALLAMNVALTMAEALQGTAIAPLAEEILRLRGEIERARSVS